MPNDQGLVVIGVHTPEFAFEKNLDNDMRVDYPIARVTWAELPRSPGHIFYDRLQSVLIEAACVEPGGAAARTCTSDIWFTSLGTISG